MPGEIKRQKIEIEIFADYFQFYLQDDDIKKGDLSDSWNEIAVKRLLAVAPFTVGIGTVRNMDVPVTIQLAQAFEFTDFEKYELVNRCGLEIGTGKIAVVCF